MEFYVKLNEEGMVADIIDYPYDDYIKVDLDIPLPEASHSGIYELQEAEGKHVLVKKESFE